MGYGLLLNFLRGAATVGGRGAATGVGEVVITQGGKKIAIEAAKGMAAVVLAKEVSKDITKQERCNKCEAYTLGNKHLIKRSMGDEVNTKYQFKIANLSSYPLTFKTYTPYVADGNKKATTPIEEWSLSGTSFDGLWPMECILVEAKGQYAQFLDAKKPDFLKMSVYRDLVSEATRQKGAITPYKTTKLTWYFYEDEARRYFVRQGGIIVTSIFMPL
ncbi:Tox-REase-5 domain-containing protein [Acinetobacter haemolyticus]|uniref:Tox-REase-5 domain-containing protein n=1 Tax=Acinetobacter haemolyticus TaxID=29430 RepID=UPI003F57B134